MSWRRCFVGGLCFRLMYRSCSFRHRLRFRNPKIKPILDRKGTEKAPPQPAPSPKPKPLPSSSRGTSLRRFCSRTSQLSLDGWRDRTGPKSSAVDRSSLYLQVWVRIRSLLVRKEKISRPQPQLLLHLLLLLLVTGPRCCLYRCWPRPSPKRGPNMLSYQPRPTRPRLDYFLGRASRRSESCTAHDPRCSLRAWP